MFGNKVLCKRWEIRAILSGFPEPLGPFLADIMSIVVHLHLLNLAYESCYDRVFED